MPGWQTTGVGSRVKAKCGIIWVPVWHTTGVGPDPLDPKVGQSRVSRSMEWRLAIKPGGSCRRLKTRWSEPVSRSGSGAGQMKRMQAARCPNPGGPADMVSQV